ncbi:MAG: ATP-dependent helicase HrpB [Desulfuromonas sp.]|nr:MAG: ATP-dependent helicase HrpB [Desulfuromonas sp.]
MTNSATAPTGQFPVDASLPQLLTALKDHPVVILEAPPGAGKTTRVPPALLEFPELNDQRILMLEPRRIAAVGAADFMARQRGEKVGATVGYTIRYERKFSSATRIEVVTEGVLTRRLQSDPELAGVGIVIFDEFHERNLHSDLALALCLDAQQGLRPDLKIIIMSATLESDALATKLGGAPVIRSAGRMFPVETVFAQQDIEPRAIVAAVVAATGQMLEKTDGDVLVFMPGAYEIDRVVEHLRHMYQDIDPCPLYGGLALADQRRAIEPGDRRKVVVATNVAETSLTIEGVRAVVDSGLEKRPRFDAARGLTMLETVRISQASARQRSGRAGRLGPGYCCRLWSEGTDGALLPQAPPEIAVADLAPLALDLASWGVTDPDSLTWIDPPPTGHLKAARLLLRQLGALDGKQQLTDLGRQVAVLPTHPRLARLLVAAQRADCPALGADLAALLDEGLGRGKLGDPLKDLQQVGGNKAPAAVNRASRFWRKWSGCGPQPAAVDSRLVARLLALAWPDHIARRRAGSQDQYLLANGMAARLDASSPLRGQDFLVAVDLHGRSRSEVRIAAAVGLDPAVFEELFGADIAWQKEVEWDEVQQRVVARELRRHGAIVLQSRPAPAEPEDVKKALLGWIARKGLAVLPWNKETERLRDRLLFFARQLDDDLLDFGDEALLSGLEQWLGPYLDSVRTVAQLKQVDLAQALLARLDWAQRQQLAALAPERLQVPGGSNVRIDYSGEQPVLAVKLQELFGLAESPCIAGGKVPVRIHMLSPAGRPLQVTSDLKSFWENGYPEVRKEMKGRYPKHPWPEDPWSAEPTRRTRRRKK